VLKDTRIKETSLADYIAMVVIFLMAIGTVFVFSAAANLTQKLDLQKIYNLPSLRQILFFPLACLILYSVSHIDYHRFSLEKGWFKSPIVYLLILAVTLLIIVLIPHLGTEINRARRWLRIPLGPLSISFQPSELAKWATIIMLAAVGAKIGSDIRIYCKRFIPICCIIGVVVALIVVEDFGTAAFIAMVSFLLLIAAGVKLWHLLTLLPVGIVGFFVELLRSQHRLERLAAFLEPDRWSDSIAYQANQSLVALGSGGLWGKGLGRGICKYGHLPEDTTDFVFAIIGEELGFVGNVVVIGLFIVFICLGIVVILRCKERFGRLLAGGIVLTIGIQAALNIGVVTVVLPTKGIPLPFVSAGGTSMLLSSAAVGVLLNIAKQTEQAFRRIENDVSCESAET